MVTSEIAANTAAKVRRLNGFKKVPDSPLNEFIKRQQLRRQRVSMNKGSRSEPDFDAS